MPIQLDDITAAVNAPVKRALTPKFFSSKLTGSGRKTGIISEGVRPNTVPMTSAMLISNQPIERKHKQTSGDVTTNFVPLHPMTQHSMEIHGTRALVPPVDDLYEIKNTAAPTYFGITPQALILKEDTSPAKGTLRELMIQYRLEIWTLSDKADEFATVGYASSGKNSVQFLWSYRPMHDALQMIQNHTGNKPSQVLLDQWMDDYDVHDRIVRLAETWVSDDLSKSVGEHVAAIAPNATDRTKEVLAYQLRYLETYGVSLAAYRDIHAAITAAFSEEDASTLCKQNLNLLMTDTLSNLQTHKTSIPQVVEDPTTNFVLPAKFSAQQREAASTNEVFTMVQAGAGTGKSTVILSRIDYLVGACNVDPKDITVLSFTNAAADNIAARNPNIGSMTIARMIHDIYNANFTGHELSSIDTIINSLDIFYPQDDLAVRFRRHLLSVVKNDDGAFTAMNTFIERNFDAVMNILSTIKQTSLELEIIICYQKIDTMVEPPEVMSRYLIIDEVQDNSIFEFIFVLKYVAKHKENLYIVGK